MNFTKRAAVAIGATLAMGLTSVPALAAEVEGPKLDWNVSLWGNPRAFTAGIETISKIVEEKTGGNFKLSISYGGLSNPRENLDGIQLGAFQVAAFCNFYHPGKNPTFMVWSLPFLPLANADVHQKVAEKFYKHPAVIKDMARWNAVPYMSSLLPQYELLGRGEPPLTIGDWKGKRVRAGGGLGEAMVVLGATRMTVPAPETYTVIDRGTVDAVAFPFTYAHFAYKIHEVTSWYTANLRPGTSECPMVINKDAWEGLPPQYQQLLEESKAAGYEAMKAAYKAADDKNMPVLTSKLKAINYSDEELAKFQEVAGKPVWDKWVADNKDKIPAQELLDFIFAEAKKAMM